MFAFIYYPWNVTNDAMYQTTKKTKIKSNNILMNYVEIYNTCYVEYYILS